MIVPSGKEYPVFRPSGANVIEQIRIVRAAASYTAEALVIECMALVPLSAMAVRSAVGARNTWSDYQRPRGPFGCDGSDGK